MSRVRTAIGVLALALFSRELHADEPRRFTLAFSAETGCVTEQQLIAEVHRYLPYAERAATKPSDIEARVVVTALAEGAHAVVDIQRAEGEVHRELDGSCAEVTRAVALILALSLDPDQRLIQSNEAPRPVSTAPSSSTSAQNSESKTSRGSEPKRSSEQNRSLELASNSKSDSNRTKRSDGAADEAASPWWFGGGALFGLGTGVAPELSAHVGLFVELGRRSAGWFAPSFRLSALRAQNAIDNAEFTFVGARFAGCPVQFGASVFVEPCLTFDYGKLEGAGRSVTRASTESAHVFGPGLSLHAGTRLVGALVLAFDLGVTAPLLRDRFFFAPDITVHRVPAVMGYAGLALGLRS